MTQVNSFRDIILIVYIGSRHIKKTIHPVALLIDIYMCTGLSPVERISGFPEVYKHEVPLYVHSVLMKMIPACFISPVKKSSCLSSDRNLCSIKIS